MRKNGPRSRERRRGSSGYPPVEAKCCGCRVGCFEEVAEDVAKVRWKPSTPIAGPGRYCARVRKARYAGALSRNAKSEPVAQKYCQGAEIPRDAPRVRRTARAGIIAAKIPAKRIITSTKGCQENSFSSRSFLGEGPRGRP